MYDYFKKKYITKNRFYEELGRAKFTYQYFYEKRRYAKLISRTIIYEKLFRLHRIFLYLNIIDNFVVECNKFLNSRKKNTNYRPPYTNHRKMIKVKLIMSLTILLKQKLLSTCNLNYSTRYK